MVQQIATTFENIRQLSNKSLAKHILLENAYEKNLVPDTSNVDYLANNNGRTNLQPLDGLPIFVDNLYVFSYLAQEECVFSGGKLLCVSEKTAQHHSLFLEYLQ